MNVKFDRQRKLAERTDDEHLTISTTIPGLGPDTPCYEMRIPFEDKADGYIRLPAAFAMNREQREYVHAFLDTALHQIRLQAAMNESRCSAEFGPPKPAWLIFDELSA